MNSRGLHRFLITDRSIWEHARLYSDRVTTCIRSLRNGVKNVSGEKKRKKKKKKEKKFYPKRKLEFCHCLRYNDIRLIKKVSELRLRLRGKLFEILTKLTLNLSRP